MWVAAQLALRDANEHGGCEGRPFRWVPVWADSPWTAGVTRLFRAVYDESLWALAGGVDGPAAHLAEQVAAKACLPLVSPVSTDKTVNLAGVPWMFSCAPADPALAEGLAAAAAALPGPLVLFSDTGHDARLASREIIKALARHALAPAFHFEFQPQAPDPAAPLAALTQAPPRVVVIAAGPADAALLAMAVRKRFPAAQLFGTHSLACDAFIQAAGPASEGVRFPLLAVLDPAAPGARVFIERFRAEAGAQPDIRAALAYDAARLLLAAVRKAGLDRAGIREALQSLSPWPGAAGMIEWDSTGRNTRKPPGLGVIKNGRVTLDCAPRGEGAGQPALGS